MQRGGPEASRIIIPTPSEASQFGGGAHRLTEDFLKRFPINDLMIALRSGDDFAGKAAAAKRLQRCRLDDRQYELLADTLLNDPLNLDPAVRQPRWAAAIALQGCEMAVANARVAAFCSERAAQRSEAEGIIPMMYSLHHPTSANANRSSVQLEKDQILMQIALDDRRPGPVRSAALMFLLGNRNPQVGECFTAYLNQESQTERVAHSLLTIFGLLSRYHPAGGEWQGVLDGYDARLARARIENPSCSTAISLIRAAIVRAQRPEFKVGEELAASEKLFQTVVASMGRTLHRTKPEGWRFI